LDPAIIDGFQIDCVILRKTGAAFPHTTGSPPVAIFIGLDEGDSEFRFFVYKTIAATLICPLETKLSILRSSPMKMATSGAPVVCGKTAAVFPPGHTKRSENHLYLAVVIRYFKNFFWRQDLS
jgi:hypothetical protein